MPTDTSIQASCPLTSLILASSVIVSLQPLHPDKLCHLVPLFSQHLPPKWSEFRTVYPVFTYDLVNSFCPNMAFVADSMLNCPVTDFTLQPHKSHQRCSGHRLQVLLSEGSLLNSVKTSKLQHNPHLANRHKSRHDNNVVACSFKIRPQKFSNKLRGWEWQKW